MYSSLTVFNSAQMRLCDSHTICDLGIPSRVLMERAARAVVSCLYKESALFPEGPVMVLCGSGNNGGDGFAAARLIAEGSMGTPRPVSVIYTGKLTPCGFPDQTHMSAECAVQYGLALQAGIPIFPPPTVVDLLTSCAVVVDAVLGIGLDRPVEGTLGELFDIVNASGKPVLAIDIPSGVYADTGATPGRCLSCIQTVTMQVLKPGLLLYPGAGICGRLAVADIGIDISPVLNVQGTVSSAFHLIGEDLIRHAMPPRSRHSHKGHYGCLGLLCGSVGMSGACVLSASSALRCGVGLAHVITPEANRIILQTALPEAVMTVYNSTAPDTSALLSSLQDDTGCCLCDGLVIGCGLGTGETSRLMFTTLLNGLNGHNVPSLPTVLDADALNLLARDPTLWESGILSSPERRVVITPHPAEMARLCSRTVSDILNDLPGTARSFAMSHGVVVVLKDAHTVVAAPDGELWICVAGNAGMAKGGSGDVLAGVIGSLLVQNRQRLGTDLSVGQVAAAGVLLHAMAGDIAAGTMGEYGMLASDIVAALPALTREMSDSRTQLTQI